MLTPLANYASEAPGSREDGRPPTEGVLYVTLYADGDRDLVGGDTPQDDCTAGTQRQGRKLARNLAAHAKTCPSRPCWAPMRRLTRIPSTLPR